MINPIDSDYDCKPKEFPNLRKQLQIEADDPGCKRPLHIAVWDEKPVGWKGNSGLYYRSGTKVKTKSPTFDVNKKEPSARLNWLR